MLALDRDYFVTAYLRCFFEEPFKAIDVFCRRYCYGDVEIPFCRIGNGVGDPDSALAGVIGNYLAPVKNAFPVGQKNYIARFHAKHADAMRGFLFRKDQVQRRVNARTIEKIHLQNYKLLLFYAF
jgi:hypothetical protein